MRWINFLINIINKPTKSSQKENELVIKSINRYKDAYKLLEEYDKKSIKHPEDLADPGRLREALQKLQGTNGNLGANSSL